MPPITIVSRLPLSYGAFRFAGTVSHRLFVPSSRNKVPSIFVPKVLMTPIIEDWASLEGALQFSFSIAITVAISGNSHGIFIAPRVLLLLAHLRSVVPVTAESLTLSNSVRMAELHRDEREMSLT